LKAVISIRFSGSYEGRSEQTMIDIQAGHRQQYRERDQKQAVRSQRSEVNLCAFERQVLFKAVQGVSRNSSFIIVEGKRFVVHQGME
jgi:hypothetical protein